MAIEKVRAYFEPLGLASRILEFEVSSATVALAAQAVGTEEARIAKTLSFKTAEGGAMLIVTAGDAKIDNAAFKRRFGFKAKMLTPDEVLSMVGHAVGGVCPFGIDPAIPVYLDESLWRFETVFPACGSSNSAIELSTDELWRYSNAVDRISVCKGWQEA